MKKSFLDKNMNFLEVIGEGGIAENVFCMDRLIELVEEWGVERNFFGPGGSTAKDQLCKLIQEVGELSDNLCKDKDITDDVGDCLVVLIMIARLKGVSMFDCLTKAYMDIKDRKGQMQDGVFIKESDLD